MKKLCALLLVLFVVVGCSNNKPLINQEEITDSEKLELVSEKVNMDYKKIVFNYDILKNADVQSYVFYIDYYKNGKKIGGAAIESNNLEASIEKNINYYNIDNCDGKKCNIDFWIENEGTFSSLTAFREDFGSKYSSEHIQRIVDNDFKAVTGEKYFIESRLYYNEELDSTESLVGNIFEEKARKADAAVLIYVVFSDKKTSFE